MVCGLFGRLSLKYVLIGMAISGITDTLHDLANELEIPGVIVQCGEKRGHEII